MQPLIRSIQDKVEQLNDRYREIKLVPVTLMVSEPETREVIIQEESSGSKASAVKVYRMVLLNGQWTIIPEWMTTTKEVGEDSSNGIKKDSSVKPRDFIQAPPKTFG